MVVILEAELKEVLGQPGCPLCRLEHMAERTYCTWFVLENYYSAPTLEALCRGGFCPTHAWRMAQLAGQKLTATYDVLVREAEQRVRTALAATTGTGFSSRWRRRRWRAMLNRVLERREPCPVCETVAKRAELGAIHLLVFLAQDEGKARYGRSDGLCWAHLVGVCRLADPPMAAFLLSDFLKRLTVLQERLAEYFRKSDYRFAHEPKGPEQVAYLEAVERFSGAVDKVAGIALPPGTKFAGRNEQSG